MATLADVIVSRGFTKPGVHSLTYKDEFCSFAPDVREELLSFPKWKEMRQESLGGGSAFLSHRQNGITTGHLGEEDRERLPSCLKFKDFLAQNFDVLCGLVGADPAHASNIEMNAMAYGARAWLSPHTDFFEYGEDDNRLAAWMLYLTAPEDGEWPAEKGGAVRVWKPGDGEERVRPQFNRFVIFRVHNDSFHEIEKVTWQPDWPNCRLALSGWIQGRVCQKIDRKTRMYLQSTSARERKEEIEAHLQGSLAMYRLLVKQKSYCGRDINVTADRIAEFEQDYKVHENSPGGTSFLRRVAGPSGCIIVVNEAGETIHFGTPEAYAKRS